MTDYDRAVADFEAAQRGLERVVADWRNYRSGWINGFLVGTLFGFALVTTLVGLAR